MDSTTGDNASKEEGPQSLDQHRQDAPLSGKRKTRMNFGPRPELENFGTAKRARTPDDNERVTGRKKRLATLAEGHTPSALLDEASASKPPIVKQGIKDLELVKAAKEGRSVTSRPIRLGSPWEHYIKRYELNLADHIYIVSDKTSLETFMIKCLEGPDAGRKVAMLERVQHKGFLPMLECFNFDSVYYPVFPHMTMPLSQVIHSPPYPTELELSAILEQILKGLQYLESRKLEHGSLSCSNIFVGGDGSVIISGQECCKEVTPDKRGGDMAALGTITVLLMQKVANNGRSGGAYDMERWPPSCNAFQFQLEIQAAKSFDRLILHPLIQLGCPKMQIKWMIDLATNASAISYTYND